MNLLKYPYRRLCLDHKPEKEKNHITLLISENQNTPNGPNKQKINIEKQQQLKVDDRY